MMTLSLLARGTILLKLSNSYNQNLIEMTQIGPV